MRSIQFPNMFTRTTTNVTEDYFATLQNLKMLLYSNKGELFGDPYFGSNLKRYLYDQNDVILRDILIDDIYTAIITFMPQLRLERSNITINSEGNKIIVTIAAINRVNYQTDLYNLVLMDTVV